MKMTQSKTVTEHRHSSASQPERVHFDSAPDHALDELTRMATLQTTADYAFVGWMDCEQLFFKSQHGFSTSVESVLGNNAPGWLIESNDSLLIEDTFSDSRFAAGHGIEFGNAEPCRSYAATPLIVQPRQVVGTLAVMAREPNQFTLEHLTLLEVLARLVVSRMERAEHLRKILLDEQVREKAEHTEQSEHHFVEAMLDSMPSLVAVLDPMGHIVRLNHACAEMTGLSLSESVGESFFELVLEPAQRQMAFRNLLDTTYGKDTDTCETEWRVRPAAHIPIDTALLPTKEQHAHKRIRWSLRSLQTQLGGSQYVILSGQDVTEQLLTEEALLTATRRYELILDSSAHGILGLDLEGRLTFINQAAASILGLGTNDLTGKDLHLALLHSNADGTPRLKSTIAIFHAIERQEAIQRNEEVFWRFDGRLIPVEYNLSLFQEKGQTVGMVLDFQDISERKAASSKPKELLFTTANSVAVTTRTANSAVAAITEQLRAPLASLKASLGLLASGALEAQPQRRLQMLEMALENCNQLTRLAYAVIDSNGTGEEKPVNEGRLVEKPAQIVTGVPMGITVEITKPTRPAVEILENRPPQSSEFEVAVSEVPFLSSVPRVPLSRGTLSVAKPRTGKRLHA